MVQLLSKYKTLVYLFIYSSFYQFMSVIVLLFQSAIANCELSHLNCFFYTFIEGVDNERTQNQSSVKAPILHLELCTESDRERL